MRIHSILIFLLLSSTLVYSQSNGWFAEGATWHYNQGSFVNKVAYGTLKLVGDTMVKGKSVKMLLTKKYDFHQETLRYTDTNYVYHQNNRVFQYYEHADTGRFCVLYDFNLAKGDSFYNDCEGLKIRIDSVYYTNINGQDLKTYDYFAPHLVSDFTGTVYEFIGHEDYFFIYPTENNPFGGLRCYEDAVLGYYNTGKEENCDTVYSTWSSVEKLQNQTRLEIWPNPASNFLTIELPDFNSTDEILIEILSIDGRLKWSSTFLRGNVRKVNTENLESGIYLLMVMDRNEIIARKKIMIR